MLRDGTTEGKKSRSRNGGGGGHVGFLSSAQQWPEAAACFSVLLQYGCSDKFCLAEHLRCCFAARC